eukprot:SAG31_NODE_54_length_29987_cov_4.570664_4_plen_60_part_00
MACNTTNIPAEDPLMDYRLFNDSLQRDAKGHLLPCWCAFFTVTLLLVAIVFKCGGSSSL